MSFCPMCGHKMAGPFCGSCGRKNKATISASPESHLSKKDFAYALSEYDKFTATLIALRERLLKMNSEILFLPKTTPQNQKVMVLESTVLMANIVVTEFKLACTQFEKILEKHGDAFFIDERKSVADKVLKDLTDTLPIVLSTMSVFRADIDKGS